MSAGPERPLWTPPPERIRQASLTRFLDHVRKQWGTEVSDYTSLYDWSIAEPERFWTSVWDFCGVVAERRGERVVVERDRMPGAQWFPDARLNFAENLLRRRDDADAVVFRDEKGRRRKLTFRELYEETARLSEALREIGVHEGDRVAGYLPNIPETIVAMLATATVGAVWSSCSPDFGVEGALDRFEQIEPKVLFTADGYVYGGKRFDSLAKARQMAQRLPSLRALVIVPHLDPNVMVGPTSIAHRLPALLAAYPTSRARFVRVPFNAPLYVLYSSGTTGKPKAIVHGVGGTLLQHVKEHQLMTDVRRDDRVFYFTTCGWMMWNWLVSALASEATVVLYDGSPFHPEPDVLFDWADETGTTHFGTSAKYLDQARKIGLEPKRTHSLETVRTILSTGSPLAPEGFDYVYEKVKDDVCLSSISGGTDIVSCFAGGNPIGPVWRGEIQAKGLGMRVEVFDEQGRSVVREKGELVCTEPFPSMPIGFWGDRDGRRYRESYFDTYPNAWCHGDWAEITSRGGVVIHGRSDTTLNPGGVRIGTAEIYRQVETIDEVLESLVIGQERDGDVRIVLFVRLREGQILDDALRDRIRKRIREGSSPRHVPARILQVTDIPRTKSGKIVELAVRDVVHGRPPKNLEALANPEALEQFRDLPELRE